MNVCILLSLISILDIQSCIQIVPNGGIVAVFQPPKNFFSQVRIPLLTYGRLLGLRQLPIGCQATMVKMSVTGFSILTWERAR